MNYRMVREHQLLKARADGLRAALTRQRAITTGWQRTARELSVELDESQGMLRESIGLSKIIADAVERVAEGVLQLAERP